MDEARWEVVAEICIVAAAELRQAWTSLFLTLRQPPALRRRLHADGSLKLLAGCLMTWTQHDAHAALAIHLSRRGPVDFVGADHAAAAAGEFVADAAVLIGVIAD